MRQSDNQQERINLSNYYLCCLVKAIAADQSNAIARSIHSPQSELTIMLTHFGKTLQIICKVHFG
ncbi:hypothetical protein LC608_23500 [Nostoc sp. XA010]|jgi:hypothetical protein|uniref:hypothetical protein n=1 Tax=Nostoc sp. XA010 TaxID=2780407 RepID=UPI001E3C70F6|nr:hypothetical protein [Nostoc sp. XA010]MCC5659887.1 hypothetical protein [Nostoc sp. XA010]